MRVLLTGHEGYIGRVLVPRLLEAGHRVTGLDSGLLDGCGFDASLSDPSIPALRVDVRDVTADDLAGFDAIIHLAGISNDPLGDLAPEITFEINWKASVRLARLAKRVGVQRFLFASSCSNYGAAGNALLDETAVFNPVTPYAVSKVKVEGELGALADARFSPVYLRAATAYGMSPRLRGDLVVNNLVGYAVTTGAILLKSDGTSLRPLVHVDDIARAYVAVLATPREVVHNEAFNVGRSEENYAVRVVAELVAAAVPGAMVAFASNPNPDRRNYRVSCDKIRQRVPAYQPVWTVPRGIEQLRDDYIARRLTEQEFLSSRFFRLERVKERLAAGTIGTDLRPMRRAA
jgi:nucleoside-diphosphate-sugar epimerase